MVSIHLGRGGESILNLPEYCLMYDAYPDFCVYTFESDVEAVVILGNYRSQNPNQTSQIPWIKVLEDGGAVL